MKPDQSRTDLGRRITARREELGLTQSSVYQRAKVSPRAYAALELGECDDPRSRTLERIAKVLRISVDELLGLPRRPLRLPHLLRQTEDDQPEPLSRTA